MISQILLIAETTLLLSVAALYIIHCPFNKVEESFNTQAIHDIINIFPNRVPAQDLTKDISDELDYKEVAIRNLLPWDHIKFPGVVPRTFVGVLLVGMPLKLARYLMSKGILLNDMEEEELPDFTAQFVLQIGSRFALSSFFVLSLSAVSRAIHRRYGLSFRLCFLMATVSQFHYMFYAGRFLPNTFAAILANLTFASWINRQYSKSIIYIALCVVIFRFDTSIFFGWLLIDAVFIRKHLSLVRVLKVGIPSGLMAILITFSIDSVFWARPTLPELESLYFNVWLNKSHEWGTQPYFWYIYSCLPRILSASTPFILVADHKITRDYLIPVLAFICTYSLLPHKELRFVLFVAPLLNICVASGLMNTHYFLNKVFLYFHSRVSRYLCRFIFLGVIVGMVLANIINCFILSTISSHNYPGGHAALSLGMTKEFLDKAQQSMKNDTGLFDPRSDVGVYVNNLAAQTGVSRFVQVNGAYYSKTPHIDTETFQKSYSLIYLILEPKEITEFSRKFCPQIDNLEQPFDKSIERWKRSKSEIKCRLPNQSQMYCSTIEAVNIFKSIDLEALKEKMMQLFAFKFELSSTEFVKTRVALHTIRCSTKSKFNPFS